jgi:hypothetical protein
MSAARDVAGKRLLFGAAAASVPVFLHADAVELDTEAGQLRSFPQTAFQLG